MNVELHTRGLVLTQHIGLTPWTRPGRLLGAGSFGSAKRISLVGQRNYKNMSSIVVVKCAFKIELNANSNFLFNISGPPI